MFYYEKFREIRKSQRLSTSYIAKKLNISTSAVGMWEAGKRNPSETTIRELAKILEVNIQLISDLQPKEDEIKEPPKDLSHFGNSWLDFSTNEGNKQLVDYITAMNKLRQINNDINQASVVIKALMASFHSIYYIKDINNQYITANYAFMDLIEKDRNCYQIAGRNDSEFFPASEAKTNAKEDEKVIMCKQAIIREKREIIGTRKKKIGLVSKIPVFDRKGRTIGLVGCFTDITEIEKKNRENQLLRNCIEQTPYVVWFGSSKDGTFSKLKPQFINSNVEDLLGISHEEYFINPACSNYPVIENDKQKHLDYLYLEKFPKQIEYRINHPEKGIRWIESSTFKNEDIFSGFLRDVTLKKERTEFIEKINSIWANTSTGIIIKKNAQIVNANQAAADLYEISVVELQMWPLTWWDYIHEDDKNGENDPIGVMSEALTEGKKRFKLNYRIKTKSGKIKYVEENLYSTLIENEEYWCCELKDVTKEAMETFRRKLLEKAIDKLPIQVWVSTPDSYIYINENGSKNCFGVSKETFERNMDYWSDIIRDDYKDSVIEWRRNGCQGSKEYPVIHESGEEKWLLDTVYQTDDVEKGEFGIVVDITQIKKQNNANKGNE